MRNATLFAMSMSEPALGWTFLEKYEPDRNRRVSFYSYSNTLVIAFYMTRGLLDWPENFEAWKTDFFGLRAHTGFVTEYLEDRPKIFDMIRIYQPRQIIVTGFSQGADHGTLCCYDLWKNTQLAVTGTVFGASRVFSWGSAAAFNQEAEKPNRSFQHIGLSRDIVTRSPPWYFGYKHVHGGTVIGGPEHWLISSAEPHSVEKYRAALLTYDATK
jgi:hypothetical protein